MSATAPPTLPRSHSSRRQQAYAPSGDRSHGPASPKPSVPAPQTPNSSSRNRSAAAAQGNLANVANRDGEQTNLARPQAGSRSDSRDRPPREAAVSRSESGRNGSSARHGHSRQHSETTSATGGGHDTSSRHSATEASQAPRRRTTVETKSGVWELGKTIGAGSMGKVKLARHRETHEQVSRNLSVFQRYFVLTHDRLL